MPKPKAIHAWLPDSEIINGITNSGFKLDLFGNFPGELPLPSVLSERNVHTNCNSRICDTLSSPSYKPELDRDLPTPLLSDERNVHTSCSGRTSSALRTLRSRGWTPDSKLDEGSRCPTRVPYTPDGSKRSQSSHSTNLSGPTPERYTPLHVLREGADNSGDYACLAVIAPELKSGPLERLQPVLQGRPAEDRLIPSGSPPRRAGGLRRLCTQQVQDCLTDESKESQQAGLPPNRSQCSRSKPSMYRGRFAKATSWHSEESSMPWPGATLSLGSSSVTTTTTTTPAEFYLEQEAVGPTPLGVPESVHPHEVYAKGAIFRGALNHDALKVEDDRKLFAHHFRAVEKATKDCNREKVAKWATVHQRRQQVYQLAALVGDPEIRDILIPQDAECNGKGGNTTPEELTPQQLAELAHVPKGFEMPGTVHAKNELIIAEEEAIVATKLKKKQGLQARLNKLQRLARIRRNREAEDAAHNFGGVHAGDLVQVRPSVRDSHSIKMELTTGSTSTTSERTSLASPASLPAGQQPPEQQAEVLTPISEKPRSSWTSSMASRKPATLMKQKSLPVHQEHPVAGDWVLPVAADVLKPISEQEQPDQMSSSFANFPFELSKSPARSSMFARRFGTEKQIRVLPRCNTMPTHSEIRENHEEDSGEEPSTPASPVSHRKERQQEMADKMVAIRERAFNDQAAQHREREMQVLEEAFDQHDQDGNHALDHGEVRHCLATLGIEGKNESERREVRNALWKMDKLLFDLDDLSQHLIPMLRERLMELRRPRLEELFEGMDRHMRGKLSIEETLDALRRLGMVIQEEIADQVVQNFMYDAYADWVTDMHEPIMGPAAFVSFVSILREQCDRHKAGLFRKISGRLNLSPEEAESWRLDLVDLYCQFHEHDPVSGKYGSSSGKLGEHEFMAVVHASGYMPKNRARQLGLAHSFHESVQEDGRIDFEGFLSIMHKLREYDRERLWRLLEPRLRDGVVTYNDVSELLPDCGIIRRNIDEEKEVQAMMEEHDEDGLGAFSAKECLPLLQQIARRMLLIQHERERQYVIGAGWTLGHFVEFRHAFQIFDEDMSDYLDYDELMKSVELLRGTYWQSQQNLDLMFVALGVDTSKEIKVNFYTFLRLMKMLDDSETRRQQGGMIGFSRDRTDMLYSLFQAMDPENDGTLSRRLLEQMIAGLPVTFTKAQIQDITRVLNSEPLQIEFRSYLRIMKAVDAIVEIDLELLQEGWKKGQRSSLCLSDLAGRASSKDILDSQT